MAEDTPGDTLTIEHRNDEDYPSDDTDVREDDERTIGADDTRGISSGAPGRMWGEGLVVHTEPGDEEIGVTCSRGARS